MRRALPRRTPSLSPPLARLPPLPSPLAHRLRAPSPFAAAFALASSPSRRPMSSSPSSSAPAEKVKQPEWAVPENAPAPELKVWNSLTRSKVRALAAPASSSLLAFPLARTG